MRINIEDIRRLKTERQAINEVPLKDIELYENDIRVEISPEVIEEWKFTGLSNMFFFETEFKDEVAEYQSQHKLCPLCRKKDYWKTLTAMHRKPELKDTNDVHCSCGWEGIVHDLLPEE